MENTFNTIFKTIITFPYTPYISALILIIVFILLLPFINLITTISKVTKLFNLKNYSEVIRKIERYFKFHRYEKTLLSFLYDSYLKLNNKQKALHYMQIATEKGFIKDKYLKMFHNTKMAQILYDLNQTTESFNKLYEVHKEGEYEASWCHLAGKIFLSQKQYENAIYYLERALFISKKSTQIYFDYTLALSFKLKEKSLSNSMELFIKNAKKEAIFIIGYIYLFKKDFANAKLWLSKASFPDNEIFECYKKLLILFCAMNLLKYSANFINDANNDINVDKIENKNIDSLIRDLAKADLTKINVEKTEFLISLNNALKSDYLESSKAILLENSLFILKLLEDNQNLKHFLVTGKANFPIFESIEESEIFSNNKIDNYIKRILHGQILLDIFDYSIKKTLIPPAQFIKSEFEQLKPTASQSEQLRKLILSQYSRLTDRGFVKVNLRVVRLFEYIPTKIRSKFLHDKGISSLRILATAIEYPHEIALFIFRRTNYYDISYKLFENISKDMEEQDIKTCYFFFNFPLDPDAQKYIMDFSNITVYDQSHLALFLEESMNEEEKRKR